MLGDVAAAFDVFAKRESIWKNRAVLLNLTIDEEWDKRHRELQIA